MRLEGHRLTAALEDHLPDYEFAFEGHGEGMAGMYYYSDTTRQLDAEMGDMLHKIHDCEVLLCFCTQQCASLTSICCAENLLYSMSCFARRQPGAGSQQVCAFVLQAQACPVGMVHESM